MGAEVMEKGFPKTGLKAHLGRSEGRGSSPSREMWGKQGDEAGGERVSTRAISGKVSFNAFFIRV